MRAPVCCLFSAPDFFHDLRKSVLCYRVATENFPLLEDRLRGSADSVISAILTAVLPRFKSESSRPRARVCGEVLFQCCSETLLFLERICGHATQVCEQNVFLYVHDAVEFPVRGQPN